MLQELPKLCKHVYCVLQDALVNAIVFAYVSIGQRFWSSYMNMSLKTAVCMLVHRMSAGGMAAAGVVALRRAALPQL